MSYEIVRNIRVTDTGVFVKSASNNVWPRDYHEWEMTYRSKQNPFTGKLAGEVEIMAGYEQGTFQGGNNKYTRALEVLRNMPEYHRYDWRNNWEQASKLEKSDEYFRLLATALQTRPPKSRYIIVKSDYNGNLVYGKYRKNGRYMYWTYDRAKATKHTYAKDAENVKSHFNDSQSWEVQEV